MHADNFCVNFLFFADDVEVDRDFLAALALLPAFDAIFLTEIETVRV